MAIGRALALGLLMLCSSAAVAEDVRRMLIFVSDGTKAGEQSITRMPDGLVKVRYIFKDNGRGPELQEQFRLAPDGTFSEYQVKGSSTYGSMVDERFTRKGDKAEWRSTSEKGSRMVSGPAFQSRGRRDHLA